MAADLNSNTQTNVSEPVGSNAEVDASSTINEIPLQVRRFNPNPKSYDFQGFIIHPVVMYHQTYNAASSGSITISTDIVDTWKTLISGTPMGHKMNNLYYARGNIHIRIVVQGQANGAGQIVFTFVPRTFCHLEGTVDAVPVMATLGRAKICPHIIIDPSKNDTYDISLPCCTLSGLWTIKGHNQGSYAMISHVYNPITSGTAIPSEATVCVYMTFEDNEFEGLTYLSNKFGSEKQSGGTYSALAGSAAKFSGALGKAFPAVSPLTTVFSAVSGKAGDVLSWLGFSKPQAVENQVVILNRAVDNWSQFDGKSTAIVLAGSQSNSVNLVDPFGASDGDTMKLSTIVAMKGLVRQYTVAVATSSQTLMFSLPVHPMVSYSHAATYVDPTPLGGVALPFTYWCGDLTFDFEFVCSVFHRATILIAWDPYYTITTPGFSTALQTLKNVTVAVSGNTAVSITVPWQTPRYWNRVHENGAYGFLPSNLYASSTCNGVIHVYLQNEITTNGSTDGIATNVYSSSKNVAFAVPSSNNLDTYSSVVPLFLSKDFCPILDVSFGGKTNLSDHGLESVGEQYVSIKQLTSKLSHAGSSTFTVVAGPNDAYLTQDLPNVPALRYGVAISDSMDTAGSFFSWFAGAFFGYKGGIRYSMYVQNNNNVETLFGDEFHAVNWVGPSNSAITVGPYTENSPFSTTSMNYAYTMGNKYQSPTIDVVCPMTWPYPFFPLQNHYTTYGNYASFSAQLKEVAADTDAIFLLSNATADDGMFLWFIGFPRVDAP